MYSMSIDVDEKAEVDWDDQWNPRIELDNSVVVKNFDRKYKLKYFHTDTADRIPHVCLSKSFVDKIEVVCTSLIPSTLGRDMNLEYINN